MTTENTTSEKIVARIFESSDGIYICDDALPHLDTRGTRYNSRRDAIAALRDPYSGPGSHYTHYLTPSGKTVKL